MTFVTALVAVFGVWIATAQWWLAQKRLKMDLFDRRWAVFQATRDICGLFLTDGKVERQKIMAFSYEVRGSRWLFDDKVAQYLNGLISTLLKIDRHSRGQRPEDPDKEFNAASHFDSEMDRLEGIFTPFMQIDEPISAFLHRNGLSLKVWGTGYLVNPLTRRIGAMRAKRH